MQPVFSELLAKDGVRFAHDLQPLAGDGADASHAEAGTGEGLTIDHIVGEAERLAHDAHFVLKEQFDRLDEVELQILGETAHVVVRLDAVLALQNVGIDGALREESDVLYLPCFFFKHANEFRADDLPLGLGVLDSRELVEEAIHRVHVDEVCVHLVAEDFDDLFGLTLSEETVIDVHAHEVFADGFDEERGDDRAVHAAG